MKITHENIEVIRHSLAHLLAMAVRELYPGAQNAIGPAIENGFYQDFELPAQISENDLLTIEKKMQELLPRWTEWTSNTVTLEEVKKEFDWNKYKMELANEFAKEKKTLTFYTCGGFVDLCKGGHTLPLAEIDPHSFKLDRVAGAYWRGDEKNKMLTRIYGLAFATKKELDEYLAMRAEAEKRDHKKLGPALDLFTFSELVGAGLPLWTPKGTLLRNTLDAFVWELRSARGYERVEIPHITKKDLYERSGHWDKFKDELFRITTREGHEFAMKPMNCPHHTQIYARKKWSYRDLPQRYANTTMVYRDEQSGELAGLARVRCITQDDAHVFCRESQVKEEFLKIWDIVHEFYGAIGFELKVRLSLHDPKHPEKYLGNPSSWKKAEGILRDIAREKGVDAPEAPGEAAFYGPKIDFMGKDSIGREWQVATIQLDMNMPERFNLTCVNEKSEDERIVMLHAAIMGAIERYLAIIIEHFAGAFPLWLSPIQVAIIPVSDKFADYGAKVRDALQKEGVRVEMKHADETLGKRIRAAEMQKIPYMVIIGEREEKTDTVNVRPYTIAPFVTSDGKQTNEPSINEFVAGIKKEIEGKQIRLEPHERKNNQIPL
ncbi:MAG: threonine--tRNA ligase [Patescibacteria group bacterium]|nr:threonine--tRNA ligase [Patescibacteria group bacterium]